jgi:hypothetical protein
MRMISYHPKHPKECDEPSQGDKLGEISKMLSAVNEVYNKVRELANMCLPWQQWHISVAQLCC